MRAACNSWSRYVDARRSSLGSVCATLHAISPTRICAPLANFCGSLLGQRLHIGAVKDDDRRPVSLLTNADVVEALHRCKYDPASAEASLVALLRRRESKHNRASANSNARNLERVNSNITPAIVVAATEGNTAAAAGNGTSVANAGASEGTSPGDTCDVGANRWEDWSEADRAAFLMHLGDKVRAPSLRP